MNDGQSIALQQQDSLHEAFELFNLETHNNSSLLSYGLNLGFIERRPNDGRLTIELLNLYPMSKEKFTESLIYEFLIRLGIFIPATNSIKIAIDVGDEDNNREQFLKSLYIISIVLNSIVQFDEISIRTINRLLLSVAIILFSLTKIDSRPCADMRKFKQKIRRQLLIDYYLWCLLFAMSFVLTCASSVFINLERVHGIDLHFIQLILNNLVALHLCSSIAMIGHGRLVPLIIGTPLLFLDVGDEITLAKGACLAVSYFFFWLSDWREMVDWNHLMLCEAGVCKILNTEPGNLKQIFKKAKNKFDEWRVEEGLDDDGWFILLDTPTNNLAPDGTTIRPHANDSSSSAGTSPESSENNQQEVNNDDSEDNERQDEHNHGEPPEDDTGERLDEDDGEEEAELDDDNQNVQPGRQLIDYSERVIYLQSRNPLLTSLAAIMLIVWK
jgi:hypothetical protein